MRWLPYYILAYVFMGLQIGLGGYLRYHDAGPNLILLAVIFIATHAPREPALLGCFVLGTLQDLSLGSSLGLFALAYSLTGMFISFIRELLYRNHPLSHIALALAAGLITGVILLLHGWVRGPAQSPGTLMLGIAYTAALAPVVLGLLQRTRRWFAFEPQRNKRF